MDSQSQSSSSSNARVYWPPSAEGRPLPLSARCCRTTRFAGHRRNGGRTLRSPRSSSRSEAGSPAARSCLRAYNRSMASAGIINDEQAEVVRILDEYYTAFSTLSVEAVLRYFHEPSFLIGPQGAFAATTHALLAMAITPAMEGLRARGLCRTELSVRNLRLAAGAAGGASAHDLLTLAVLPARRDGIHALRSKSEIGNQRSADECSPTTSPAVSVKTARVCEVWDPD